MKERTTQSRHAEPTQMLNFYGPKSTRRRAEEKKKTQAKVSRTKMTGNESLLPKYRLSEPIRARVMRQLSQLEPEARTKMKV